MGVFDGPVGKGVFDGSPDVVPGRRLRTSAAPRVEGRLFDGASGMGVFDESPGGVPVRRIEGSRLGLRVQTDPPGARASRSMSKYTSGSSPRGTYRRRDWWTLETCMDWVERNCPHGGHIFVAQYMGMNYCRCVHSHHQDDSADDSEPHEGGGGSDDHLGDDEEYDEEYEDEDLFWECNEFYLEIQAADRAGYYPEGCDDDYQLDVCGWTRFDPLIFAICERWWAEEEAGRKREHARQTSPHEEDWDR